MERGLGSERSEGRGPGGVRERCGESEERSEPPSQIHVHVCDFGVQCRGGNVQGRCSNGCS